MRPQISYRIAAAFVAMIVAVMAMTVMTAAEVPRLLQYQGRLTDDIGAPLNTTVSLTFAVYSDSLGTVILWEENHPGVTVADGLFDVLLGRTTSFGSTLFDGSVRYLGISVDGGEVMQPLTAIVTSAYAFRAVRSDTTSFAYMARQADTAVYATNARRSDTATVALNVAGGGWVDAGNVVHLSTETDSVGIGTSSPGAPLEVQGGKKAIIGQSSGSGILAGAVTGMNSGDGHGVLGISTVGPGVRGMSEDGAGVSGFSASGFGAYFDAPKHYFSGSVGIGTGAPEYPLDVHSSAVSIRGYTTGGPATAGIYGRAQNDGYGVMGTSSNGRGVYGASTTGFGGYFYGPKHYFSNLTGFGTEEPTHRVTVNGAIGIQQNGTTKYHLNYYNNGFNISETTVADYRLYIKEGGNVGIGTSNPTKKLYVNGDAHVAGTFHADAFEANAIGKENIRDEPGLAGSAISGGTSLTTSWASYLSRQITVPAAGHVLAIGCANVRLDHGISGVSEAQIAFSDVTNDLAGGIMQCFRLYSNVSSGFYYTSIPCQRIFNVSAAGTYTYYLIAKRDPDNGVIMQNKQMVLLYIPTSYASKSGEITLNPEDILYIAESELETQVMDALESEQEALDIKPSSGESISTLTSRLESLTAEMEVLKGRLQAVENK